MHKTILLCLGAILLCACGNTNSGFAGGGGSSSGGSGGIPSGPSGDFLYVTNSAAGNVSAFSILRNGALTPILGTPFIGQSGNSAIAVAANAGYAYTISANTNAVLASAIDPDSGVLTQLPMNPYAVGRGPSAIVVDPANKFVFTANLTDNSISSLAIQSEGTLLQSAGSPYAAGNQPQYLAVNPNGNFLYASNGGDNSLSVFAIAASGALVPLVGSPVATGLGPRGIAIDPAGKFVYVINATSQNLSVYSIDAVTGALTPLTGSPFPTNGGASIAIEATGRFLYLANGLSVDAFSLQNGIPVAFSGTFNVGSSNRSTALTTDSTGTYVYVLDNLNNNVAVLTIDPLSGGLATVAGSPFMLVPGTTVGLGATSIVVTR